LKKSIAAKDKELAELREFAREYSALNPLSGELGGDRDRDCTII
jgi:hypothetical protein